MYVHVLAENLPSAEQLIKLFIFLLNKALCSGVHFGCYKYGILSPTGADTFWMLELTNRDLPIGELV